MQSVYDASSFSECAILLHNGRLFDFLLPDASVIDIELVAHALSNLCRFTGHTREYYSVAQHSVLVSSLLPTDLAFAGLLHDAGEALIGDVSKPLQAIVSGYKPVKERVEKAVFEHFGIPWPLPKAVKRADRAALLFEMRDLFGYDDRMLEEFSEEFQVEPIRPMQPKEARQAFLRRYSELGGA